MLKVKTHWEARWEAEAKPGFYNRSTFKEQFDTEHECRLFAMQKALELFKSDKRDYATKVTVYEVETHEEVLDTMTANSVTEQLTRPHPKVPPAAPAFEPETPPRTPASGSDLKPGEVDNIPF